MERLKFVLLPLMALFWATSACTMLTPASDDEAGTTTKSDTNDEVAGDGDGDSSTGDGDGETTTTETGNTDAGTDMPSEECFVTATQVSNDLPSDCEAIFGQDACILDAPALKRGELLNGIGLYAWYTGQLQGYEPMPGFAFADVGNNHPAWNGTQAGAWLHLPLPLDGEAFLPDDPATCEWWELELLPAVLGLTKPYAIIEYASPSGEKSKSISTPFNVVTYKVCGVTLADRVVLTEFPLVNNPDGDFAMPVPQPGVNVYLYQRDLGALGLPEEEFTVELIGGVAGFVGLPPYWDANGVFDPMSLPYSQPPGPLCIQVEVRVGLTLDTLPGQALRLILNASFIPARGVVGIEPLFQIAP